MLREVLKLGFRRFKVILERDHEEGCWVTCVPALNYLSDWGETQEEAIERTREAIIGYLETLEKEGLPLPAEPDETEVREVVVSL